MDYQKRRYSSIGESRTLISSRLWVQIPLSVQNKCESSSVGLERLASNQKVAGSSPVSRSKKDLKVPVYEEQKKVSLPSIWGYRIIGYYNGFAIHRPRIVTGYLH